MHSNFDVNIGGMKPFTTSFSFSYTTAIGSFEFDDICQRIALKQGVVRNPGTIPPILEGICSTTLHL